MNHETETESKDAIEEKWKARMWGVSFFWATVILTMFFQRAIDFNGSTFIVGIFCAVWLFSCGISISHSLKYKKITGKWLWY
ncbi:hypothetical protein [Kordiimonas sp. SCSIO 12610]|uniref:hypothetical protein n=1 Tax=Kordiimonas sp. SCSIO 12610 TaxID=2829597 RepID=UPI00210B65E7|nr:hypothetical protein [Kordiimonas sp. SCSIO 12610]UTW53975.1 hypothetical protein KFF44_08985 [Kordiimonas sp. SCSIO 12610]